MKLKNIFRKTIGIILFLIGMTLTSCSERLCSAYARSEDRVFSMKLAKNRSSIPSPYSANYKAQLQKKYSGPR